jgi:TolB-like protein/DNA-binding winged helix-turn-helix (wHTH) protein/tetratricopeptide (TPR) repeat protein
MVFGDCRLDAERGALIRNGIEIRLRPQSFEVLRYLAAHANRLVTKEELFKAVWGSVVVTDDSLAHCLIDVRRAIADERREIVRTVPRRGYVFAAPVRRVEEVLPGADGTPAGLAPRVQATRAARRWAILAAILLLAAIVAGWMVVRPAGEPPVTTAQVPTNTIAVLAFEDMSKGQDLSYFSEGIAEEILNLLTHVPGLRVVARTSSFSFRNRDTDIPTIGRALQVAYILEGSVRRAGDTLRVTAQLVDARTGMHVWSETFDRQAADLLAVQTDIAGAVARALEISDSRLAAVAPVTEPATHEHVLHGRFLINRRAPGDLAAAQAHFEKALELDPDYVPALVSLGAVHYLRIFEDRLPAGAQLEKMRVAVTRALVLDPLSAEAHVRASTYYLYTGNPTLTRKHYEEAQALDPNHVLVLGVGAGIAAKRGDMTRALELQRRAVDLDPLSYVARANYARFLAAGGRFTDAIREIERAGELGPDDPAWRHDRIQYLILTRQNERALSLLEDMPQGALREQSLILALRGLGRDAEADAQTTKLRQRTDEERALPLAEICAQRGEADMAFVWLAIARRIEQANALTPSTVFLPPEFLLSPLLLPLHGDPRWEAMRGRPADVV